MNLSIVLSQIINVQDENSNSSLGPLMRNRNSNLSCFCHYFLLFIQTNIQKVFSENLIHIKHYSSFMEYISNKIDLKLLHLGDFYFLREGKNRKYRKIHQTRRCIVCLIVVEAL